MKEIICRKGRERFLKDKLVARIDRQLDLRRIIESQVTLMTLLRRQLTKKQKIMLDYQRDRLPNLNDLSASAASGDDIDTEVDAITKHSPKRVKRLLSSLQDFVPVTELDHKLLLGIIERGEPQHHITKLREASSLSIN